MTNPDTMWRLFAFSMSASTATFIYAVAQHNYLNGVIVGLNAGVALMNLALAADAARAAIERDLRKGKRK